MRDFERLGELSSAARAGLKANGVIWAIDQALAGVTLDENALRSLRSGGELLRTLADPTTSHLPQGPRRSQNMLGSENVRRVRNVVVLATRLDGEEERVSETLSELADILESLSKGESAQGHSEELERALAVFSAISEVKLGLANGIVRAGREQAAWLPRTTISPLS
jgi:hypothetical protein